MKPKLTLSGRVDKRISRRKCRKCRGRHYAKGLCNKHYARMRAPSLREASKLSQAIGRETLCDAYVRATIAIPAKIPARLIPIEMVAVQRELLKIKRL